MFITVRPTNLKLIFYRLNFGIAQKVDHPTNKIRALFQPNNTGLESESEDEGNTTKKGHLPDVDFCNSIRQYWDYGKSGSKQLISQFSSLRKNPNIVVQGIKALLYSILKRTIKNLNLWKLKKNYV